MSAVRPRDNPFSAQRIDRLPWRPPAGQPGLDGLLERLDALGGAAAVVGPKGRGKTTLLEALARRLEQRGARVHSLRLSPHSMPSRRELRGFLRRVDSDGFLVLDGYDHLSRWWRHRVRRTARSAAGLLVAAHRPGSLPVLLEARSTPGLLADLVAELLDGSDPPMTMPSADELFERHGGNLRLALREMYDRFAGVALPSGGTLAARKTMEEPYVTRSEEGVYRIRGTRVSLDSVVYRFLQGETPETIAQAFPVLSLEQVYGAVAYYLANRETVDAYLEQGRSDFEAQRREARKSDPAFYQKLAAARRREPTLS